MSDKRPIVVLTGPTAVGKTELSIQLAKAINGEIISADSMQVYKKMDIGTAKIRPEEMMGVKHYLIDEFEPDEEFNVMKFKEYTDKYMNEIYEKGKIPILVGGTGFYIQAVLKDVEFKEEESSDIRKELEAFANVHGPQALHERLAQIDPKSAEVIHQNNVRRVIRAIEFYEQTGMKFSEHNENEKQKQSPFNYVYFVLNQDRKILYDRIEKRIDIMMKDGLVEEVKSLISQGYGRDLVSMQGLGYKEIVAYLEGEITLEEAVYILKRDTRHFAKRQITWFKRETDVTWLDKDIYKTSEEQLAFCMEELKRKHIL
jgi:tRNA dimethylallyltransferase